MLECISKISLSNFSRYLLLVSLVFCISPAHAKGYRRVVVQKSDNFEQVFKGENTRYIIRFDFDLSKYVNGIIIGENSMLDFRGGSLNNGKIAFNATRVKSKLRKILLNNIYSGSLSVEKSYPEWFGAVGDGNNDDTKSIQDAMDVSNAVFGTTGKTYAVKTSTPYQHCLTVNRDSLEMNINLLDINAYTASDYRGRGVIFIDNKDGFSFDGCIKSVNDKLPISASSGMTLEGSRAAIICYGDCGGMTINLECSNLYCGIYHGTFMEDKYLYRNGSTGVHNSSINVRAFRVAYPVALNLANHCNINVYGDHMHRCVYLCGDNNIIDAQGRNYYGTAAPAHVLLLSNVVKDNNGYKIVTCNHNNVTYQQLDGETENLNEGSMFQFQELRQDLNNKVPHSDYSFVDNTVNLYCCKVGGQMIQHLYKSFASDWKYDKNVKIECTFNVHGDISSYLSYCTFVFFAGSEDYITINNYSEQQLIYMFSYSGNPQSVYSINGNSKSRTFGSAEHPFYGTVKAAGKNVYINTVTGGAKIIGEIYAEGDNVEVVQNEKSHSKHVHIANK